MGKFKVWIEDDLLSSSNCQDANIFDSDNQRRAGFRAGTGASAIRVNTALRQANLIAVALVNALEISDDYNVKSSVEDMTDWFKSTDFIKASKIVNVTDSEVELKTSIQPIDEFINLGLAEKPFNSIFAKDLEVNDINADTISAVEFIGNLTGNATQDGEGNIITATYPRYINTSFIRIQCKIDNTEYWIELICSFAAVRSFSSFDDLSSGNTGYNRLQNYLGHISPIGLDVDGYSKIPLSGFIRVKYPSTSDYRAYPVTYIDRKSSEIRIPLITTSTFGSSNGVPVPHLILNASNTNTVQTTFMIVNKSRNIN